MKRWREKSSLSSTQDVSNEHRKTDDVRVLTVNNNITFLNTNYYTPFRFARNLNLIHILS